MFHFYRLRSGAAELFEIVVPRGFPDADTRFGPLLRYGHRDEQFHGVGVVVLIHGDEETQYVISCRGQLTSDELRKLYQQLEMLAGRDVHTVGGEPIAGWFDHGGLRAR